MPGGGFAYQQHVCLESKVETGIGVAEWGCLGRSRRRSAICAMGNFFWSIKRTPAASRALIKLF